MRIDHDQFTQPGAVVIALRPDGPNALKRYWTENHLPNIGCADIRSRVADGYYQEVNLFMVGRMPALFATNKSENPLPTLRQRPV
jgi:peroxiredoxin Q/BCP